MKFAAAYYLLLIYATVILKPLIPVAEDALLHCFAGVSHVLNVHAVEGNDHVEKEMADASGANDDSSKNQKADKTEQTIHETSIDYTLSALDPYPFIYTYPFINESLSNIYIAYVNPPPRIVS